LLELPLEPARAGFFTFGGRFGDSFPSADCSRPPLCNYGRYTAKPSTFLPRLDRLSARPLLRFYARSMTVRRIRGRRLQRIRHEMAWANPLCVECEKQGRIRAWTELDHKQPLTQGGLDIPTNRQGLCKECHRLKTINDLGHVKVKERIGLDGYPVE
jgi:5-methylcytosine-specific restriction protein A